MESTATTKLASAVKTSFAALPWWAFCACWLGGVFDGMDSSLMAVVLPKAIGQLIGSADPKAITHVGSMVTAWFLLGWTLGGFLLGWVGDRYGRLKAMLASILMYSLFTGLSGLSQQWEHLALCRFLTGLGIGGELVSIATYLTEIWPASSKTLAIGGLLTSYQAGVFLAGGLHYLVPDWRLAFFVGALPALFVVVFRLTLKESSQWTHATSAIPVSFRTSVEQSRQYIRPLIVGSLAFTGLLVGYWASLSWIPTWVQSLVGSNGPQDARSLSMMGQGLAAVVGCLVGGWLCQRWGRPQAVAFSTFGCFAASTWLFQPFQPLTVWHDGLYANIALLGFFIGMGQATLYVYIPELFPTAIRAFSTGLCLNTGRLLTIGAVLSATWVVAGLGGYAQACWAFSIAYLLGLCVWLQRPNQIS
jgi:MFS family permease